VSTQSHGGETKRIGRAPVNRAIPGTVRDRAFGFLSLFTSFGTLICCALPSLLVLFGLGTTVASVLTAAPWLVTLSRHKDWVFAISGMVLALNLLYVFALAPRMRAAVANCTDDACATADQLSRSVLWTSAAIYVAGVAAAYVLPAFLE
jgi:hypothetical protein